MLESWLNIIKQKTRAAGQSVLKAQRLLSNSWIGWEAHTKLKESVWELSRFPAPRRGFLFEGVGVSKNTRMMDSN